MGFDELGKGLPTPLLTLRIIIVVRSYSERTIKAWRAV
jgi:hypothetical protein